MVRVSDSANILADARAAETYDKAIGILDRADADGRLDYFDALSSRIYMELDERFQGTPEFVAVRAAESARAKRDADVSDKRRRAELAAQQRPTGPLTVHEKPMPQAIDWRAEWHLAPAETEWLAEPLIPARRSVSIFSPAKVGKSMLLLEAGACLATGTRRFLGSTIPSAVSVLYVDAENSVRDDVIPRLKAMGFEPDELDRLHYLSFPDLASLDSHDGGRELMRLVHEHAADVVIIDTMSRTIEGEENSNDTAIAWHRHTGARLKEAGVALVRLDHSGHEKANHARGASAKAGDVDATWSIERVSDNRIRLKLVEARFLIAESDLLLDRTADPVLHHKVVVGHVPAIVFDDKVAEVAAILDREGQPLDVSKRAALAVVRGTGASVSDLTVREAIKARRRAAGWSDDDDSEPSE